MTAMMTSWLLLQAVGLQGGPVILIHVVVEMIFTDLYKASAFRLKVRSHTPTHTIFCAIQYKVDDIECKGTYSAASNNTKLVH